LIPREALPYDQRKAATEIVSTGITAPERVRMVQADARALSNITPEPPPESSHALPRGMTGE